MKNIEDLYISDYNYPLPEHRIAQQPLLERNKSKLLVFKDGNISEDIFENIQNYIPENSMLVLNNTRVIHARLLMKKKTGAKIEIFCLEPAYSRNIEKAFSDQGKSEWMCMVGNASKWHNEILEKEIYIKNNKIILYSRKISTSTGNFIIEFSWTPGNFSFSEILFTAGAVPLPPYIKRAAEEFDEERYQTVFAQVNGSVAAPTAGLHFTPRELNLLKEKNIDTDYITLNVGAGTFKPVKSEKISGHEMHHESFSVSRSFIEKLYTKNCKLTASGTTVVRTLESLYLVGTDPERFERIKDNGEKKLILNQWDAYKDIANQTLKLAMYNLLEYMDKNKFDTISGETGLLIVPGFDFKLTDIMITNFHLPMSTLLLLVSAFIGDKWKDIYYYALDNDFRFLSYGDSSILFKNN